MAIPKYAGWWDSLSNFLTQWNKPGIPQQKKTQPAPVPETVTGPQDLQAKMQVILNGAKSLTMVLIKYGGDYRYVEPYSYRFKKSGRLFYGFCHKDQRINSFHPYKIEDIQPTKIPYKPRWPVEIGLE